MYQDDYVYALSQVLVGKSAQEKEFLYANFIGVLTARGHLKLLPHIQSALQRISQARERRENIRVSTRSPEAHRRFRGSIETYVKEFGGQNTDVEEIIDENIIGGFRIEGKDHLVDASYRKMLLELYKKMVQ